VVAQTSHGGVAGAQPCPCWTREGADGQTTCRAPVADFQAHDTHCMTGFTQPDDWARAPHLPLLLSFLNGFAVVRSRPPTLTQAWPWRQLRVVLENPAPVLLAGHPGLFSESCFTSAIFVFLLAYTRWRPGSWSRWICTHVSHVHGLCFPFMGTFFQHRSHHSPMTPVINHMHLVSGICDTPFC
jgi:hypothetical protein